MNSCERYINEALSCHYEMPAKLEDEDDYLMASIYIVIHNDILKRTVLDTLKAHSFLKILFKTTMKTYIKKYTI